MGAAPRRRRRNRVALRSNLGVDRVFLALLRPGRFPVRAFAQASFAVAQDGEEGHGFLCHQFGDQRVEVEGVVAGIERGDGQEIGIVASGVGERAGGDEARIVRPASSAGPPADRAASRAARRAPCFSQDSDRPTALVFGPLDQPDGWVGFDQRDAAFDDGAVVGRPVAGQVGDGRRAMTGRTMRFPVSPAAIRRAMTISKARSPKLERRWGRMFDGASSIRP